MKFILILVYTFALGISANSAFANSIFPWRGSAKDKVDRIAQTPTISQEDKSKEIARELAELDRSIQQNPRDSKSYFLRGLLKQNKLNNALGALADYDKAIELNPKYADLYLARSVLKVQELSDKAGAIQDLRQAAQILKAQGRTSDVQIVNNELKKIGAID